MAGEFILSDYISEAMAHASYEKLADGSFSGRIDSCSGVVAFAGSLSACEIELRAVLEGWILLGLQAGHPLPVLAGIDLNRSDVGLG